MSNYIEIKIKNISEEQSEILIAQLNEIGFNGFEEGENFLIGFIDEQNFDEDALQQIISAHHLSYQKNFIQQKNWNEEWEKNFDLVIVDDFVAVRAEFHQPIKNIEHEIIITPKMSFGTGHHATTYMMIQQMGDIDFNNKTVFDFGTGTGILAILAEKLGAKNIIAIDNDEWSINNAKENSERNNCKRIQLFLVSELPSTEKFDIVLANINKNVILQHVKELTNLLAQSGQLLISGLLIEDETEILDVAVKIKLKPTACIRRGRWISIRFTV
jgi:ribosomal protein L11 methyltransferase